MVKVEAETGTNNPRTEKQYCLFEHAWAKYKYRSMHPERKSQGILIIRGLASGKYRP